MDNQYIRKEGRFSLLVYKEGFRNFKVLHTDEATYLYKDGINESGLLGETVGEAYKVFRSFPNDLIVDKVDPSLVQNLLRKESKSVTSFDEFFD